VAELRTERLVLRQWRDEDLGPFAELNADAETMRYFPAPPSREESDALAERARRQIEAEGWGLWAVEVAGSASFIGFVGLARPSFEEHFTPAVEVGWRLAREHWGPAAMQPRRAELRSPTASRSSAWTRSSPSPRGSTSRRGGSWSGSG
jgi:RimJ/RimL family protein N-acetyltransferase